METGERSRAMRIRLTFGPEPYSFNVFDAETGEKLTKVMSGEMSVDSKNPIATISLLQGIEVDATFDAEVTDVYPKKNEAD